MADSDDRTLRIGPPSRPRGDRPAAGAAKGKRYSQLFRSAGNMLQRGRLAEAIEVLERGAALARAQGDAGFAELFEAEAAAQRRALAERGGGGASGHGRDESGREGGR